jgi:hypothetical protein
MVTIHHPLREPRFSGPSEQLARYSPNWRIATEFDRHPEGALVFETSYRTSAVQSKMAERRPIEGHSLRSHSVSNRRPALPGLRS